MEAGTEQWCCRSTAGFFAVVNPVLSPASPQAEALSRLFVVTLFVCAVIFVIVSALVLICILRYRSQPNDAEPAQIAGNHRLEVSWTVASILILVGLFVLTVQAMRVSDPAADRPPDLTVIGHQWWWEARYPSGAVTANEIHIPTGIPLIFRIETADVIHDFWVPELGRKIDAIPGRPVSIWLAADKPGTFTGACAEYCGVQHAWMRITVVAEPPDAFAKWETHELSLAATPTDPAAARGAQLFQTRSCAACHAIRGGPSQPTAQARYAPDLTHVAERSTLGAGVIDNTRSELGRWLQNPQAIKVGCHMPDTELSEKDADDLVAYFETLR
jgi:cytochrome c oxidase subunit 2